MYIKPQDHTRSLFRILFVLWIFCFLLFGTISPFTAKSVLWFLKKFFFSFVIFKTFTSARYLKLLLVSNRNRKKKCVCGIFTERKGLIWFLKSQKAPAQSSAWLVDAKAKRHPFNGWEIINCYLWFYGGYFVINRGRMIKLFMCKNLCYYLWKLRKEREGEWGQAALNPNTCLRCSFSYLTLCFFSARVPDARAQNRPSLSGQVRKSCIRSLERGSWSDIAF